MRQLNHLLYQVQHAGGIGICPPDHYERAWDEITADPFFVEIFQILNPFLNYFRMVYIETTCAQEDNRHSSQPQVKLKLVVTMSPMPMVSAPPWLWKGDMMYSKLGSPMAIPPSVDSFMFSANSNRILSMLSPHKSGFLRHCCCNCDGNN